MFRGVFVHPRRGIPLHEPHVGVYEGQPQRLAGLGVGLLNHPTGVGEADKAVEIGDGDRLCVDRIGPCRGRREYVKRTAKKRSTTGDGHWRE
jgi:hypothetical protein